MCDASPAADDGSAVIYDAVVMGGGPAGAMAAMSLARMNRRVLVIEKTRFPRFHVGESLIPQDMEVFADFGLLEELQRLPHVVKRGAEFVVADKSIGNRIRFADSIAPGKPPVETFNMERAEFDRAMLAAARRAGAEIHEDTRVEAVDHLEDGDIRLSIRSGSETQQVRGRYLIDATGQSTVLGRHLKTRKNFDDPSLQKVAYFGHFENVDRNNALAEGDISMVLADEAWFWMIPIDSTRVSIGMVLDAAVARQVKVPSHKMLAWGIQRCPLIRERVRDAVWPERNNVASDFSYSCAPYAGPGYFLVGDAATFLDPVFSSGIFLGMEGARRAAAAIHDLLAGRVQPAKARRQYCRFVQSGTSTFYRIIRAFYRPSFRDLFLDGQGPVNMHRAVVAVLAGQVFPKPAWAVRWRMNLFYLCVWLQRRLPLTDKKKGYSLLSAEVDELSSGHDLSSASDNTVPVETAASV